MSLRTEKCEIDNGKDRKSYTNQNANKLGKLYYKYVCGKNSNILVKKQDGDLVYKL